MESEQQSSQKTNGEISDDYSLDRVPRPQRKMGWISITNIMFGIATAIFYFQMEVSWHSNSEQSMPLYPLGKHS